MCLGAVQRTPRQDLARAQRLTAERNVRFNAAACLAAAALTLTACESKPFPVVMTKRWAVGSALSGQTFSWARFETVAHCEIVARHLNGAKASGQFSNSVMTSGSATTPSSARDDHMPDGGGSKPPEHGVDKATIRQLAIGKWALVHNAQVLDIQPQR